MPFNAGGRWYPPPNYHSTPPQRPAAAPAHLAADWEKARTEPAWEQGASDWYPENPIPGPQILEVDGRNFGIPEDAQVKRPGARTGVAWVLHLGGVYVFSARGVLLQTAEQRAAMDWSLL